MTYEIECPCCGMTLELNIENDQITSIESKQYEDFLCSELVEFGVLKGGEQDDQR